MNVIPMWTLVSVLALVAPCAAWAGDDEDAPVIAEVNGFLITVDDFQRTAARMRAPDDPMDEAFKREVLEEVVSEFLLYEQALKQDIDEDPKIRKMMVNTLLKRDVYGTLDPSGISEEELRSYFDAHKEEFVVPEKVQIKRIEIRIVNYASRNAALLFAEDLQRQATQDPSRFKELAQAYSSCPYARRGGDLGFVGRKGKPGVDEGVIDLAFTLAKGEVSPVVEIDEGFYFLYIPNRRERVERTFEQMRGSVLRKVKSNRYNDLYDGYIAGLREGATIRVDEGALGAIVPDFGGPSLTGPPTLSPPGEDAPGDE